MIRSEKRNLDRELCVLLGTLAAVFASPALALDWQVRTKPGEEVVAHSYTVGTTTTCQITAVPRITLTVKPVGGSVAIRKIPALKISAKRYDDDRDTKDSCVGMTVEGIGIYYTPRPDFHGTDQISYTVDWPRSRIKDTVTVEVK
jgi:hypothetical protein